MNPEEFPNDIFICGGAQIYEQALPRCSDLYLTLVKREVEGDAFFPPFEDKFELAEEIRDEAGVQDSALPAQVAAEISGRDGVPRPQSLNLIRDADNGVPPRNKKQADRCQPACRELNFVCDGYSFESCFASSAASKACCNATRSSPGLSASSIFCSSLSCSSV